MVEVLHEWALNLFVLSEKQTPAYVTVCFTNEESLFKYEGKVNFVITKRNLKSHDS